MLKSNKAFQSEFDRRISQALETAKGKWQTDYDAKLADEIKKVQSESESSLNAKIAEYEEKIKYRKGAITAAYFNTFDDNFVMNGYGKKYKEQGI